MKVVVTGSAGFIGGHTVRALADRGDEVIPADRKTGTDLAEEVERWHPRPDAIIHLASSCSTPGSLTDPMGTFRDTVLTAVNVLEAARQDHIPVLLTSSVKARDGQTPYGAAKRMVETWALEYHAAYELPLIINRPGTVYGPGQEGSPESGWIAWFCEAHDKGLPVTINGSGHQKRDLLHVSDYVRLLLIQLDNISEYQRHVWDVGGGEENAVTVRDMATYLGLKNESGPARYGDAQEYIGENNVPFWTPEVRWWKSETLAPRRARQELESL